MIKQIVITTLLLLIYCAQLAAEPVKPSKHIVLIETMPIAAIQQVSRAFINTMHQAGYHDGDNLRLTLLTPNGDATRIRSLLQQVLHQQVDLVVSGATLASQISQQLLAGTDIPQIFYTVADPVGAGLITEIGKPSGKLLTGKIHSVDSRSKIETILTILQPTKPIRIGIVHSSYPSAIGDTRNLIAAAQQYPMIHFVTKQIDYHPIPAGLPTMLQEASNAIAELEPQVDYWWQAAGPLAETPDLTRLLRQESQHPLIFAHTKESVRLGALLSMAPDYQVAGKEVAGLALAIFNGANIRTMPVTPVSNFTLAINLQTALQQQLTIDSNILKLAGLNIYRTISP